MINRIWSLANWIVILGCLMIALASCAEAERNSRAGRLEVCGFHLFKGFAYWIPTRDFYGNRSFYCQYASESFPDAVNVRIVP